MGRLSTTECTYLPTSRVMLREVEVERKFGASGM